MRPCPCRCYLLAGCLLLACAPGALSQPPKNLLAFPPRDSPVREAAARYRLSMNMLLFPDYFMTDQQLAEAARNDSRDSNLDTVVAGLKAYGYPAQMPRSAQEYRAKVYPLILDFLKKAGYVAVEVPVNGAILSLCPELRRQIEKRGLAVTTVGMAGEDLEASLKPRIDAAHALGAGLVAGPVVLPFKQYPKNAVGDARVAWVKQRLTDLRDPMRRLAEYARSKNVRLAVEPLNRFELPGLNRLQQAIDFARAVDHSHFGVMIDTCHEMSDGDGPEMFVEQVKTLAKMGKLFHCHISAIHRGRIDRAWIDWRHFFGALKAAGYKGNMSMEIFDATLPFSDAVHINRPRFANPMEVALAALIHSATKLQKDVP